jgi:hypothetical protein
MPEGDGRSDASDDSDASDAPSEDGAQEAPLQAVRDMLHAGGGLPRSSPLLTGGRRSLQAAMLILAAAAGQEGSR